MSVKRGGRRNGFLGGKEGGGCVVGLRWEVAEPNNSIKTQLCKTTRRYSPTYYFKFNSGKLKVIAL